MAIANAAFSAEQLDLGCEHSFTALTDFDLHFACAEQAPSYVGHHILQDEHRCSVNDGKETTSFV